MKEIQFMNVSKKITIVHKKIMNFKNIVSNILTVNLLILRLMKINLFPNIIKIINYKIKSKNIQLSTTSEEFFKICNTLNIIKNEF